MAIVKRPDIQVNLTTSGLTLYARIWGPNKGTGTDQIWDDTAAVKAFVNFKNPDVANYAVSLAERTTTKFYSAVFPAEIPSGEYTVTVHDEGTGGVEKDDEVVGSGRVAILASVTDHR